MDWDVLTRHPDIHRFVRALNAFRQRRDVVAETGTLSLNELLRRAHIEWHGVTLNQPDWSEHSRTLAFTLRSLHGRFLLHGMLNAWWEPLTFELPAIPAQSGQFWRRCMDTALPSPDDMQPLPQAPQLEQATYTVQARSMVVLARALQQTPDTLSSITR